MNVDRPERGSWLPVTIAIALIGALAVVGAVIFLGAAIGACGEGVREGTVRHQVCAVAFPARAGFLVVVVVFGAAIALARPRRAVVLCGLALLVLCEAAAVSLLAVIAS